MSHEKRQNRRISTSVEATLYYNSLTLMGCRTRDISLTGACIDAESLGDQVLPQNAQIDMIFSVKPGGEIQRIPARVARVGGDGLGIAFQYSDYAEFCNIVELVSSAN